MMRMKLPLVDTTLAESNRHMLWNEGIRIIGAHRRLCTGRFRTRESFATQHLRNASPTTRWASGDVGQDGLFIIIRLGSREQQAASLWCHSFSEAKVSHVSLVYGYHYHYRSGGSKTRSDSRTNRLWSICLPSTRGRRIEAHEYAHGDHTISQTSKKLRKVAAKGDLKYPTGLEHRRLQVCAPRKDLYVESHEG